MKINGVSKVSKVGRVFTIITEEYDKSFIGNGIEEMHWKISNDYNNHFNTFGLYNYGLLFVIFVVTHFIGQGISKRNDFMFLNSFPYTKKQIKYNEILCFILTGLLFIIVFVYMTVMRYINYRNLLSIVEGYFSIVGIEIIKMVLIGIISVLFIMIVDSMFSNSIIGLVCMMALIPFSLTTILYKIREISEYVAVKDGKNIYSLMRNSSDGNYRKIFINPLIDEVSIKQIYFSNMLVDISIALLIIFVLFVVYNKMQKLNSLEYGIKIFSSKINEKIIRVLCSIGVGCFAGIFFGSKYTDELMRSRRVMYEALTGINLIKALSTDIEIKQFVSNRVETGVVLLWPDNEKFIENIDNSNFLINVDGKIYLANNIDDFEADNNRNMIATAEDLTYDQIKDSNSISVMNYYNSMTDEELNKYYEDFDTKDNILGEVPKTENGETDFLIKFNDKTEGKIKVIKESDNIKIYCSSDSDKKSMLMAMNTFGLYCDENNDAYDSIDNKVIYKDKKVDNQYIIELNNVEKDKTAVLLMEKTILEDDKFVFGNEIKVK